MRSQIRSRETPSTRGTVGQRLVAAIMAGLAATLGLAATAWAQPAGPGASPSPAPADLATRVADLKAYVTNGTPKALVSSGPGHNAWMMASSALVLFMTLPGLALFYGGLVRR